MVIYQYNSYYFFKNALLLRLKGLIDICSKYLTLLKPLLTPIYCVDIFSCVTIGTLKYRAKGDQTDNQM